jgi:hypothetical protein
MGSLVNVKAWALGEHNPRLRPERNLWSPSFFTVSFSFVYHTQMAECYRVQIQKELILHFDIRGQNSLSLTGGCSRLWHMGVQPARHASLCSQATRYDNPRPEYTKFPLVGD